MEREESVTVSKGEEETLWCVGGVCFVLYFWLGKDVATNVEVYWPDGRSVARPLEPSDLNSVLEIRYPREEDEVTPAVEIEVHWCVSLSKQLLQVVMSNK